MEERQGQHSNSVKIDTLQLNMLKKDAGDDFDPITLLAARICDMPIAVLSFFDEEGIWLKSKTGTDADRIGREAAVFANNPLQKELIHVSDYNAGDKNHGLLKLTKQPLRSYASCPLMSSSGNVMGFLSVLDTKVHVLKEQDLQALSMLAKQVSSHISLRMENTVLMQKVSRNVNGIAEMRMIFENDVDAVIVMDPNGRILIWNPKAETVFGWSEAEVKGKMFQEILIPERYLEYHLMDMKGFSKVVSSNKKFELSALCKNNEEVHASIGISSAEINGERFFICYASDITDIKLIAEKLDKQKAFYENILNKIPTDIAVFDNQHRYIFVNPGAIKNEELRKYIIGKDDFEYAAYRNRDMTMAKERRQQFLDVKNSGKEIRWEDSLVGPDGQTFSHLRRLFPVHDENGELSMVIGFGIDITERKLLEEKQLAYVEQLSAQNVQLVDFCNIVSHNLRAPLVNMSMLVNFIEESTDEEEKKLLIEKLKPVIENLHTTFNELVESIQIKQDLEIKSEKINLDVVLQRTLDGLQTEINNSGAVIEKDFAAAQVIYYPPKYLFSIFHNLISNSLKYKSPDRKPHIRVATKVTDGNIILSVSDNGLGIDLDKHKENFFKIGKVFHRNPNAKGFGLYMTKTQVEAMDGKIWADSIPNQGTTFFVEFKNQNL